MSQCHLSSVKVEEVHELDRSALAECGQIDALRFVVELQFHRVDFDMF